jgi:hypothetical protein
MSSLRYITESSGSSITSFSMTDVFTSDFDTYKVILDTIDFANADLFFRFINSNGEVIDASNYDDAVMLQRSYSAFGELKNIGATSIGSIGFSDVSDKGGATELYVFNPFNSSSYTSSIWQNAGAASGGTPVRKGIGILKQMTQVSGINFNASSSILNIRARIYGLRSS